MNQYLVFISNQETLGINIDSIDRIIEYKEANRTPNSLDCALGVTQYDGRVISLVDLTRKLYHMDFKKSPETKSIIAYLRGGYVALVVDNIVGIKNFSDDDYEENRSDSGLEKQYIEGFIKLGDDREDIILIIDIDRLFTEEELRYLETGSEDRS